MTSSYCMRPAASASLALLLAVALGAGDAATAPSTRPDELARFHELKLGMTPAQVHAIVKLPYKDVGSGLYIEAYELGDGSAVIVGYDPSLLIYVKKRVNDEWKDMLGDSPATAPRDN